LRGLELGEETLECDCSVFLFSRSVECEVEFKAIKYECVFLGLCVFVEWPVDGEVFITSFWMFCCYLSRVESLKFVSGFCLQF